MLDISRRAALQGVTSFGGLLSSDSSGLYMHKLQSSDEIN